MTVEEMQDWLRGWVADQTGLAPEEIGDDKPLENLGLSSRDVVVLSGQLEKLTGTRLDATVAYEFPTIAALTRHVVNGGSAAPRPTVPGAPAPGTTASASSLPEHHDIAVVGMAARFPGANDTDEMWDLLVSGRSGTSTEPPAGRWSEYAGDETVSRKLAELNMAGGYFDDIASFDAEFFGLSPLEATNMDPQQRIMLELTWRALEDAHLPANELRGKPVGVFYGSSNNDYGMLITADPAEAHPYALTGTSSSVIPNRVSYAFDFRGPSVSVDTACSSSLVAVHDAVKALRSGEADVALGGGVNIMAAPFVSTAFAELGVISPTGGIHAFSDDADGFVRGDGAGVLVLKRVADAVADGDEILAVIKGSAVNSDGHSNGLTAPNPDAQVDVLRRAYADAGVDPATVDYVEAHGTGTILGDPIEATALGAVLGAGREPFDPLLLGSAKTNFGHTESAAGSAGLIKVVLAMQNRTLPPSLNFSAPNHFIDFDAEHLEVVEDPREWPAYSGHMLAGVSGFGFGGTNAHVVVAEWDPADYPSLQAGGHTAQLADPEDPTVLLPVSGLVPSRRKAAAAALADHLEANPGTDLVALERALAGHNHGRSRAIVAADDVETAVNRLRKVADGVVSVGIRAADAPASTGPVFVYSGFGSQHRKMAKELCALSPLFADRIDELDETVRFESGWSMCEIIEDDGRTYDLETAQVTITAIQIALTDLLVELGVRPAAVMGMSMGEFAAAYACGGVDAHDAMLMACHRARLMGEGERTLSEDQLGAMAVVELSAEQLEERQAADERLAGVEPAVYTAPGMLTVGGPRQAVLDLVAVLEEEGKFARALKVKGAGHTSMLQPIMGELEAEILGVTGRPITVPLFSSVDRGRVYEPGEAPHDAEYFLRCTRHSVWFEDATRLAFERGHSTMVEIAPNPVAIMGLMKTAFSVGRGDAKLLFALKRKVPTAQSMRDLLAEMYVAGAPVDLLGLHGSGEIAAAPGTPFKPQHFWTAARPSAGSRAGLPGNRVTLPGGTVAFAADAAEVPSTVALLESAAAAVDPEARLVASEEPGSLPAAGEVTTVVTRSLGGLNVEVHAVSEAGVTHRVAEGFALAAGLGGISDVAQSNLGVAPVAAPAADEPVVDPAAAPAAARWDPESGETVEQRLRAIVSESMGYDVDDLPVELPLIDLGLDSLMGMRIKNRVENDFQIPPLQVQALRDASVADVITMVEDLVAQGTAAGAAAPEDGNAAEPEAAASDADAESQDSEGADAEETADAAAADADTAGAGTKAEAIAAVAPRDAAERMAFGTWAGMTGAAVAGVTHPLPAIDADTAAKIAERLTERSGIEVSAADVTAAESVAGLADLVRAGLESPVDGNVRVLRERLEGSEAPAVVMFHPAGGNSAVYQPLTRRLPEDVPVYGIERLEGPLAERATAYLDDIRRIADGRPIVLGGWSFGGALAYEVAHQLKDSDVEVALIALLDTVQPAEPAPDTLEETKARWGRYAAFAKKTYGLDFPVPTELLETAGEDAVLGMLGQYLAQADPAEHSLAAGVLEHQRASFADNRILDRLDLSVWADVTVPVVLYRAERMHDGAIELEPAYARINPDGGWAAIVDDLAIVQLHGDHLGVVDEPEIATVGADLTGRVRRVEQGAAPNLPTEAEAAKAAAAAAKNDNDTTESSDRA